MTSESNNRRRSRAVPGRRFARAQLTLVEHCLCPLDSRVSLRPGFQHTTKFSYSDKHRNRRSAIVEVGAMHGISPHDDLYLWGLLALAFSQAEPRAELYATPYYVLRQLGIITSEKRGGREFELFRAALKRIAGVRYQNDSFYDPLRGEHRSVSFGLLNYSLPLNAESSRAWRFAWDPIFFELASATGGALSFDLGLYRDLDPACRRLYLYLKKLFWRKPATGQLDLRDLAEHVLGFSSQLETADLKKKVSRCIGQLLDRQLLILPDGINRPSELFTKQSKGIYRLRLHRGAAFLRSHTSMPLESTESSLADPLRAIGFDDNTIHRILNRFAPALIEQWADITLAAKERHGAKFFSNSPQAYFMDNVKAAAAGRRTPPDWWRELRKEERQREQRQQTELSQTSEPAFEEYLQSEARDVFGRIMTRLTRELRDSGQPEHQANQNAEDMARTHLLNRYRRDHPGENQSGGFQQAGSLI